MSSSVDAPTMRTIAKGLQGWNIFLSYDFVAAMPLRTKA